MKSRLLAEGQKLKRKGPGRKLLQKLLPDAIKELRGSGGGGGKRKF